MISGATCSVVALASPKGTDTFCELCQRRAHVQCSRCQVTFYCDAEHQRADWVGIHERICQLLVPLRSPTLFSSQHPDCIETQIKKVRMSMELIEICKSVAQSKFSEGKYQEALPAAQFCLRCSMDVHGPSTAQLVPAYLLLAEANMGLGNLDLVTQLLSQAEWVVLKSPECGHTIHHQLHKSLGLLHMATGNLEAALFHFANNIYFASEEYGPDSPVTCGGYFLMANIFARQGKMSIARSLYSEVAQTWHCLLTKRLETHSQKANEPDFLFSQRAEVEEMLRTMLEFEQNASRKDSAQVALVAHCLAMLWFLEGDSAKVSHITKSPSINFTLTQ
uniref:Zinc finger, MYND-type containing 12 n=1 Tax=Mastacembelus armatus TaxID=205130 RepID=A0A3Q3SNU9_9TELE